MNRFFTLLACALTMTLTSCQFSENIYINEDGSGRMEFSMDASEMMEMVGQMGEGNSENGMDKAVDSTIVFKDFLEEKKDSIATLPIEDQQKIKALEDFKMHMVMNPETKKMVFDLNTEFKDANELQDMFKAMNSFSNLQGTGGAEQNTPSSPFSNIGEGGSTDVQYSFDGHVFKRSAKIVDQELHQQAMDSLGEQSAMMFGSSKYKINYHFPRAVKSFSKEGAMYSEDRKTVTFEVGFMDVLKDPELLDFEVVLEDK
ncbi:hypothetical protein [Psychroserpens damuponensis]|uniref:hypothetical protein n=1 Tax=Psychroserpens damuponensis TaxID=943936 RepID=UPI00058CEF02|nr:hypothetical protein [Psychroserpens damuponensis]